MKQFFSQITNINYKNDFRTLEKSSIRVTAAYLQGVSTSKTFF